MILMALVTLYVGYLQRKQKKPSSLKW
jgi:hypothetical protein